MTERRTRLVVDIEWHGHPDAEPGDEYYNDDEVDHGRVLRPG